jgi:hypothetical protein
MSEKKQRPVSSVPQAGEPSLASLLPSLTEPSLEQMGGRAPGEDVSRPAIRAVSQTPTLDALGLVPSSASPELAGERGVPNEALRSAVGDARSTSGKDAVKAAANLPIPGTPAKVNPLKGAVKVQGDF